MEHICFNNNVDIQLWLIVLKIIFLHDLPSWNPNVFIVDNNDAKINNIKYKSFL